MSAPDDRATTSLPLVGPGRVLGDRYELVSTLGSGGMAVVFLGRDQVLGREVAVKILREQYALDPVFLDRFTREALHAASLSHPGLVTIFDAGLDRGTAYIVMEVVHGRTLHDVLLAEGPLAIDRAVQIAADVCEVLDVAHQAGVVHRDIKPGNISISDTGRTQVFDFGIARTDGSVALTEVSTVVGTAEYLSPEQAGGGPADSRSDLYAVGCVLMEMLTGSAPFTAETPVALLHQHLHDEPTPPSAARPQVGAALDAVVLALLSKDPSQRPATAAQARHDLLASGAPAPSATRVLPIETSASEPSRPSRAAAVAAAVIVLVVAIAVLLGRGDTASTGASPSGSPSGAIPSTSVASPSGSTPAPLVVPSASTVAGALGAVRTVIAAGEKRALIDPAAVTQLRNAVDEVAVAVEKGKGKAAEPRAQGLVDLVAGLARDGRIDSSAAVALRDVAAQLLRLVAEDR